MQKIRTTNDLEGLHNKWNKKAKGQLQFYALVDLLAGIGAEVELTTRMMQQGQELRLERKKTKDKNNLLQSFWARHVNTPVEGALEMIRELARLIKPNPRVRPEDLDRLPDEVEDE